MTDTARITTTREAPIFANHPVFTFTLHFVSNSTKVKCAKTSNKIHWPNIYILTNYRKFYTDTNIRHLSANSGTKTRTYIFHLPTKFKNFYFVLAINFFAFLIKDGLNTLTKVF